MKTCGGNWRSILVGFFSVAYVFAPAIFSEGNHAKAQIIPDGTLGDNPSRITPNVNIKGSDADRIDGGVSRGANLFHSFREFNVGEFQRVYFANPTGIENILTRVTGSNVSKILGTLGVNGGANLFVLNPNGILFGNNARLDVAGSFVASTANAIQFGNQGFFSATNPQTPSPLLTVNPSALFFNQLQAGRIENRSIAPAGDNLFGLRVPDGRSLLLVGGDIAMNGGRLNAPGGRVELAGVAGEGTVGLNVDGSNLSLSIPGTVARADVSLINGARVDVRAGDGGGIAINARNLDIAGRSLLAAGIRQGLGTADSQAGDITLDATDTIQIRQASRVENDVNPNATGNSGNLFITTALLLIPDFGQLSASTFGQGNAGSVVIAASDRVSFAGTTPDGRFPTAVLSTVEPNAKGQGGNIYITTGTLELTNGAQLITETRGEGNAGNIVVEAEDRVTLAGIGRNGLSSSGIFSSVRQTGKGKSGDIRITTDNLELTNGAILRASTSGQGNAGNIVVTTTGNVELTNGGELNVSTSGQGNAGNIVVEARDRIRLDHGLVFSNVDIGAEGNGGDIRISSGALFAVNGGELVASTAGTGDAGNVIINVRGPVSFDGLDRDGIFASGAFSTIDPAGVGQGGDVRIYTRSLSVTNGAGISAYTAGEGNAGNVIIDAHDTVVFDGISRNGVFASAAESSVQQGARGNGGDIRITTGSLSLTNNAQLVAKTFGNGKAGGIDITTGSLSLTNGAQLLANTSGNGDAGSVKIKADTVSFDGRSGAFSNVAQTGVGKGGGIDITTGSLSLTNGSQLLANTYGKGDAGSVKINADTVYFDGRGSDGIFTSAVLSSVEKTGEGKGGAIDITTGSLSLTNGAGVTASTLGEGQTGSITITTNAFEATNGSQLLTATSSNFDAGDITLKIRDNITLSGSNTGIFANTTPGSIGKGGSISIDPRTLTIQDGAKIAVDSQGRGIGGNVELAAGTLTLDNGIISAETSSNTGGNITLNLQDLLLLSNGSQISTTAGDRQFGGDGGNITINTPFIVAIPKENSDITANAFSGSGGIVNITANGIFGISRQERPTANSDITASSQFGVSGEVTINTPDTDPSRGLVQLPSNLVDASQQIASGCTPRRGETASRFISTGRGGLPQSPNEPLRGRAVITGWVDLPPQATQRVTDKLSEEITHKNPALSVTKSTNQIVEATGWIVDANGDVILVAQSGPSSSIPSAMSCGQAVAS